MTEQTLAQIIGDPQRIDAELQQFRKDSQVLSDKRANLIAKYPEQWIAIYDGEVRASAPSLRQLLATMDEQHLPRKAAVVRYVDRTLRRMIL